MSAENWDQTRIALQDVVKDAVSKLLEFTGSDGFEFISKGRLIKVFKKNQFRICEQCKDIVEFTRRCGHCETLICEECDEFDNNLCENCK